MIPLRLELENFLSYRQRAELDFTGFHLACIAGENGAGKSSLLDAMTWALFGKCRAPGRDDVVNRQVAPSGAAAHVQLDFQLESSTYRIHRVQKPGKTGVLEFQLAAENGAWKSLTEATQTQTQARLESLLRMNYETFANASFLLQGRADEFTIKRPGERKRILGELLGVNHWERYKDGAASQRREQEKQIASFEGQLKEIVANLETEKVKKQSLAAAKADYSAAVERRETQEKLIQSLQAFQAAASEIQTLANSLALNLANGQTTLEQLIETRSARKKDWEHLQDILAQDEQIEQEYADWQAATAELQIWQENAMKWNQLNNERQKAQLVVEQEKSRLEQERAELLRRETGATTRREQRATNQDKIEQLTRQVAELKEKLAAREELQTFIEKLQSEMGALKGDQPRLTTEIQKLKSRQVQLQDQEISRCPLCNQELTLDHRAAVIAQIEDEHLGLSGQLDKNRSEHKSFQSKLAEKRTEMEALTAVEVEWQKTEQTIAATRAQVEEIEKALDEWSREGEPRLDAVQRLLAESGYAAKSQVELAKITAEMDALAYDDVAHRQAQQEVNRLSPALDAHQRLNEARAARQPLERNLEDLERQIADQKKQVEELTTRLTESREKLEALGPAPEMDLLTAERELNRLREVEAVAGRAIGAAEQALKTLEQMRGQRVQLSARRRETAQKISRLKTLERAFGRNGVQALLIEQALPTIQDNTNELLDRLTGGEMRVSFSTQRKLKTRDAMAETLAIHIADAAGERPYEMYSGGEAFRVNFAIRIALSRLLAQRAGARLQTLVIDEGFGSQDPEGRQRLIEAINTIRPDFARVLVITHIDELKDAFPVRIEVVKGLDGSQLAVI